MPEREAIEDVRSGLRSISLTPAPGDTSTAGTTEDIELLADMPGVRVSGCKEVAKRSGCKGNQGWDSWMKKRAGGDRYLARMGEEGSESDENEDECEEYGVQRDDER